MKDQDTYFVITGTADGETFIEQVAKDPLLARLDEQYYNGRFAQSLPDNNTAYWNGRSVIIKGTIVTPVEKTVVVEYEI